MHRSLDIYAYDFHGEPECSVVATGENLAECVTNARHMVLHSLLVQGHDHLSIEDVLALPSPVYQDK